MELAAAGHCCPRYRSPQCAAQKRTVGADRAILVNAPPCKGRPVVAQGTQHHLADQRQRDHKDRRAALLLSTELHQNDWMMFAGGDDIDEQVGQARPCALMMPLRARKKPMRSAAQAGLVSADLSSSHDSSCVSLGYNWLPFARRSVYQYGTVCSNGAFLGSALVDGIWGSSGLLLSSIYLIPQRVAMWSVGVSYFLQDEKPASKEEMRADRRAVLRKTFTHPCILAVVVGMVLMASQLPLPGFLGRTVKSLSNCNMGVSMILIGAIIGSSRMGKLWDKDCFLYCLIRLGLIPAAVLLGCRLCGADSLVTGVSVVLAAMPMGGVTAVLAEKYGGDSAFASKCVAVSTVLSLITTPLWCMVV